MAEPTRRRALLHVERGEFCLFVPRLRIGRLLLVNVPCLPDMHMEDYEAAARFTKNLPADENRIDFTIKVDVCGEFIPEPRLKGHGRSRPYRLCGKYKVDEIYLLEEASETQAFYAFNEGNLFWLVLILAATVLIRTL